MKKDFNYDFSGYVTKYGLKCTDGRTIIKDAFKDSDGITVPMVWHHQHDTPDNVLGHMLLESRDDGIYGYAKFNETESGKNAKILVQSKDIESLSIYANDLVEKSKNVIHGFIREASLVLAGSNPGAKIDYIAIQHADGTVVDTDDEAIIYTGLLIDNNPKNDDGNEEILEHADDEETIEDVFNTLDEKQKDAVYAIVGAIMTEEEDSMAQSQIKPNLLNKKGIKVMKKNVFDGNAINKDRPRLSHDQLNTLFADAREMGSLKAAFLKHAGTYGIDNIDYLFPDAQAVTPEPSLIKRDMEWVPVVYNGARHTPFSRIKSLHADITVESARALGYVTGAQKKEEVFGLLRRITTPTTIYKKQKLDRDDIIDITDLDVVAWLKAEMRIMLNEEIARAALLGDGRDPITQAADKIDETNIRPIWKDVNLYAHHHFLADTVTDNDVMDEAVRARIAYRGSGSPTMFVGPTILTEWSLLKDQDGRRLYPTLAELASVMRVSSIVEVPLMDALERDIDPLFPDGGGTPAPHDLLCIIVNMRDYTMGADKGGQTSFFDDFDIDYNQFKYLLEGRMSGALTVPKSAIVIERAQ